jgi:nitroreductase
VPRSIIERLIEVGRFTPTGSNSQGVRYIVLTDPKAIEELRRAVLAFYGKLFAKVMHPVWSRIMGLFVGRKTVVSLQDYGPRMAHAARLFESGEDPLFHKAPVILIAYSEKSDLSASFNGAAALYACSLMAHSLGLGCCFNGFLEAALNQKPSLRSLVGMPAGHRCTGAMTLGYPDIRYRRQVPRRSPDVIWR